VKGRRERVRRDGRGREGRKGKGIRGNRYPYSLPLFFKIMTECV